MKFSEGTVLMWLAGGNKYKVVEACATNPSQYPNDPGLYLLECIDFWCEEEMGDMILCNRLGQKQWYASYHIDHMLVWELAE